jgi:DNA-binding CsgD family transcriptional regulator
MHQAEAADASSDSPIQSFVANIQSAANMNVAMDVLAEACQSLGFPMVCYSYLQSTRLADGRWAAPPLLTRNYPAGWDAAWERHNANDPYYHACFEGSLTIEWDSIQARGTLDPAERDSWHYLADKRLQKGVTVPIHLPGRRFAFVSAIGDCADEDWGRLVRSTRETLFLLAHHFHSATFRKFQNPFPKHGSETLSARELECLTWAANGKTAEDIACILGRSVETVRIHLKRAGAKLAASNRAHAVAKASYLGLIDFPH